MFWHWGDSHLVMTQTDGTNSFCIHETYFGVARSPAHLWTSHPLTIIHCQFAAVLFRDSNALTDLFSFSPYVQFCIFAGFANVSEHRSPREFKTWEVTLHTGICIAIYHCRVFFTLSWWLGEFFCTFTSGVFLSSVILFLPEFQKIKSFLLSIFLVFFLSSFISSLF